MSAMLKREFSAAGSVAVDAPLLRSFIMIEGSDPSNLVNPKRLPDPVADALVAVLEQDPAVPLGKEVYAKAAVEGVSNWDRIVVSQKQATRPAAPRGTNPFAQLRR